MLTRVFKNIHQWENAIELAPKAISKFLRQAGKDNFEVNLEHRNLEKSVNRMVQGLITASLFLGSAILWSFNVPPSYNGYSIIGVAGVIISAVLSFNLMRSINKKERNQ
jgi:ubiquinone biosynthesis protein